MEDEQLKYTVCTGDAGVFKQGESIVVQMRFLNDDQTPIENLGELEITVLISTARSSVLIFGHNTGIADYLPVEVDADGYLAFELDAARTAMMQGKYFMEISVARNGTKIITATMPAFEIVPSRLQQIAEL